MTIREKNGSFLEQHMVKHSPVRIHRPFFARYDQNTVDTLKNTFTQEVNLNGQK